MTAPMPPKAAEWKRGKGVAYRQRFLNAN